MNILGRILGVLCQAIGLAPMATAQSNSTNSFDLNEVWYVVIGAVIGFVASIGTVIVERILDRRGKLKLYYQISGGRNAVIPYGFQYTQAGSMCFFYVYAYRNPEYIQNNACHPRCECYIIQRRATNRPYDTGDVDEAK